REFSCLVLHLENEKAPPSRAAPLIYPCVITACCARLTISRWRAISLGNWRRARQALRYATASVLVRKPTSSSLPSTARTIHTCSPLTAVPSIILMTKSPLKWERRRPPIGAPPRGGLPPELGRHPDLGSLAASAIDRDDVALGEVDIERYDRSITTLTLEPQIAAIEPTDRLLGAIAARMLAPEWDDGGHGVTAACSSARTGE